MTDKPEPLTSTLPMPIVILLQPQLVVPTEEGLTARLKLLYPESFAGMTIGGTDGPNGKNVLVITVANLLLTVMAMDYPMPLADLEFPVKQAAAANWPTAPDLVNAHKGHLIVTALVRTAPDDPVAYKVHKMAYGLVTQLAAALVEETGANAAYWGMAGLLQKPKALSTHAAHVFDAFPPADLWVNYHARNLEDGSIVLGTSGLSALLGRELQTEPSRLGPRLLLDRVGGVVAYLLAHGPVVNDGDTVGVTQSERIRVRHVATPTGQKLYYLGFERVEANGVAAQ